MIDPFSYVEVKAVDGTLHLSSNEYQILGMLESLENNRKALEQVHPGADHRFKPKLLFMTTSNTVIGQDILDEANRRGVRIFQMKATCGEYDNGDIEIGFGPFKPLNFNDSVNSEGVFKSALMNYIDLIRGLWRTQMLELSGNPDNYDQDDN